MNRYGGEGYTGTGYYGPEDELVFHKEPKYTVADDLEEFDRRTELSAQVFSNEQLDQALAQWTDWSKFVFKTWDLEHLTGISGSIFRLENERKRRKTDDFKFTIRNKGFQRNLKPNMDRLREEVDCDLAIMDRYKVGGIERYSGATHDGSIQLIVSRIGADYRYGWISIADQMFIPIVNKWRYQIDSMNPSWNVDQKITQPMTLFEAIDYQRNSNLSKTIDER